MNRVYDPSKYRVEPGATVIRVFGGVRETARWLGMTPESVSQWQRPVEHGGRRISRARRTQILVVAKRLGVDDVVTPALLGRQRLENVGRASKVKGDRFEYQVVRELVAAGLDAHRVPLSGAVPGYHGDVRVRVPGGEWVLQCKISGYKYGAQGRVRMSRLMGEVSVARIVLASSGAACVLMRRPIFMNLLKGLRPRVVNMPRMRIAGGAQVIKAMRGHDALVFRSDGVTEWYAVVSEARFGEAA